LWVFQASENPFSNWWIGKYNESAGQFLPSAATPSDHALTLALGVVPKSGAVGGAHDGGRRLNWGFIPTWLNVRNVRKLQCGSATMPCVRPAPDHAQSVMSLPLEMALQRDSTVAVFFVKELEALRLAGTKLSWVGQPRSKQTQAALPTHAELQPLTGTRCCSSRHFELNVTLQVASATRSGLHVLTTPLLPGGQGPLTDFAFTGQPLATINDTVYSHEDCAQLCEKNQRCMSWTYVPGGLFASNPYKVRCELKSTVGVLEAWTTMVTGLPRRASNITAHRWEAVLVGYDPVEKQVFISRELCGHSMTDLPEMPADPFWRTFTNLTLAVDENLELQMFVDGPLIELVANRRAVLSISVWPGLNVSATIGSYGGARIKVLEYYELSSNLRPSDMPPASAAAAKTDDVSTPSGWCNPSNASCGNTPLARRFFPAFHPKNTWPLDHNNVSPLLVINTCADSDPLHSWGSFGQDPNGPFKYRGVYHLFMQVWCPLRWHCRRGVVLPCAVWSTSPSSSASSMRQTREARNRGATGA
jgi:hypothetical protein